MIIAVMTSGCITFKTGNTNSADVGGGVYKTVNKGTLWRQKVLVATVSGQPGNFAAADVSSLAIDPSDHKALYFGSTANGLFYTYDGGDSWQKAAALGNSNIRAIAVDPESKCVIYAGFGNKLVKTEDCSRSWQQKYIDDKANVTVNTVAVDHFNDQVVYIGLSRGDLIKSADGGETWQTINRFGGNIRKALIDPDDSRVIYVITAKGLFASENGGTDWHDLNDPIKAAGIGADIRDLALIKGQEDTLFLATAQGMVKSEDRGITWNKIELIAPEKKLSINAIAVNPKNTDEIYYTTNTTFNRSADGGVTWTPLKSPSARAGAELIIDPEEPNTLYMGMRTIKK